MVFTFIVIAACSNLLNACLGTIMHNTGERKAKLKFKGQAARLGCEQVLMDIRHMAFLCSPFN